MTDSSLSEDERVSVSSTKEPQKPKRKKARRACLACQRAHLTCGDERPCQRCMKRGLQDACHDGMRKKAKYLHDAPNEALMPGTGEPYHLSGDSKRSRERISQSATRSPSLPAVTDISRVSGEAVNDAHNRPCRGKRMSPSPSDNPEHQSFTAHPGSVASHLIQSQSFQRDPSQIPDASTPNATDYDSTFFDAKHPPLHNFDLASMNFGNHYGALEFGILGHLSSGADETLIHATQHRQSSATYEPPNLSSLGDLDNMGIGNNYSLNIGNSLADWQSNPSGHGLQMNSWNLDTSLADFVFPGESHSEPHAYAIGAFTTLSTISPEPGRAGGLAPLEGGYADSNTFSNPQQSVFDRKYYPPVSRHPPSPRRHLENGPSELIAKRLGSLPAGIVALRKRRRNPTSIYSTVTKPYPYTQGFHALTAVLQRRVSSQKRLAIAQALASIRPSFISCTRTLMDDDLVFMEKCFQRQLMEYEDHVSACGTPTIVCRRTGEVAYAGKEFSLLTGWSKDVLLGRATNLNVNGNDPASGSMTGTSSRTGFNTPRIPVDGTKPDMADSTMASRPQAVFLAELLDDDSIVQFYEDFAKLAFADSKGSAWSACRLLKYKTKDDPSMKPSIDSEMLVNALDSGNGQRSPGNGVSRGQPHTHGNTMNDYVRGEIVNAAMSSSMSGYQKLHHMTKVDCMYCWTVRRDVFDIPMMIVINFLPII